ncbi:hypothetical protein RIX33_002725 [Vibrio vulnificus]|nr:hypothetical protein [Vibrio vulnificus]
MCSPTARFPAGTYVCHQSLFQQFRELMWFYVNPIVYLKIKEVAEGE